jgi:hypothetical protein
MRRTSPAVAWILERGVHTSGTVLPRPNCGTTVADLAAEDSAALGVHRVATFSSVRSRCAEPMLRTTASVTGGSVHRGVAYLWDTAASSGFPTERQVLHTIR